MQLNQVKLFLAIFSCIIMMVVTEETFAAPPFINEDPIPTDYHHVELYLFAADNINKDEFELFAPGIELNYGIAYDLQLSITIALQTERPREEDGHNSYGISDTQVGLKYMFVKETKCLPAIALAPVYVVPNGNENTGIGNGRGWFFIPIALQKSWGKWTSYGGGGYAVNSAQDMKNFWYGGVVVQRELNDKWTVGGELYSQGAESTTENAVTLINIGAYYALGKDIDLLFSVGNNILGARNFITYIGLGFEW